MKKRDDRVDAIDDLEALEPPDGIRAHDLEVGGETLLVITYPLSQGDPLDGSGLSAAERQVARLAIDGLSNVEIAARRGSSARTVANQMASILRKLDLASRRELTAWYFGRGACLSDRDGCD